MSISTNILTIGLVILEYALNFERSERSKNDFFSPLKPMVACETLKLVA